MAVLAVAVPVRLGQIVWGWEGGADGGVLWLGGGGQLQCTVCLAYDASSELVLPRGWGGRGEVHSISGAWSERVRCAEHNVPYHSARHSVFAPRYCQANQPVKEDTRLRTEPI